jgi:hypothetical protein
MNIDYRSCFDTGCQIQIQESLKSSSQTCHNTYCTVPWRRSSCAASCHRSRQPRMQTPLSSLFVRHLCTSRAGRHFTARRTMAAREAWKNPSHAATCNIGTVALHSLAVAGARVAGVTKLESGGKPPVSWSAKDRNRAAFAGTTKRPIAEQLRLLGCSAPRHHSGPCGALVFSDQLTLAA